MTIKTIIGDKVDISQYLEEYPYFNLYLSYIERTGYILIAETPANTNFNIINSNETPDYLYLNYNQDKNKDFYKLINSYLIPYKKHLKEVGSLPHEIKQDIESLIINIIDELTLNLSKVYETDNYSKIKNYENKEIKDYLKKPVNKYNSLKKKPPTNTRRSKRKEKTNQQGIINPFTKFLRLF